MNYEGMSDFEINRRVGKVVFELEGSVFKATNPMSNVVEFITGFGDEREFQYFNGCNNPSDAWPIILDNAISIQPVHAVAAGGDYKLSVVKHWTACTESGQGINSLTKDNNPLRAAMICFLKMKDDE